ncbi:hypothetical protein C3K47_01400 [Solitalea longa]|uniref:DUF6249 domain-containing protein n=1 Tax=Solitalea longa TaxID=2079460 RepID=A0A2S5AA74_9SPHI|nr:DUF6249 domain-containing protein [Solitalea longa]POY39179.1 hypothetical protein C3K47_01400 [Solitalea longa]
MEGILVPILISLGAFLMVFGLRYLENKERMAMIERGMDPGTRKKNTNPAGALKWGLLFIGVGTGLLLALILTQYVFVNMDEEAMPAVYFGLIFIGGGFGLITSYNRTKKEIQSEKQTEQQSVY